MTHRVILTGGGTGGHVYPALAVAEQLNKRPDVEAIIYIGVHGHLEERLAKERNIDFIGLKVSGMPRTISPKLFSFPWQLTHAIWQAIKIIKTFKPTVILGTGGYAAAPALSAAILKNIPFAIHEPDSHPGLVNKVYAKHAKLISLGMAAAQDQFRQLNKTANIVFSGNPVAEQFCHLPDRQSACQSLGLDPNLPVIFITGGSQGAQALNQAVYDMLPLLVNGHYSTRFQILHQTGEKNWPNMENTLSPALRQSSLYKPKKYFDDMATPYAACNLAVCRSGAMTIAELAVTGTPAIFIPYPHAAADHQNFNAQAIAATGAALVIKQNDLSGATLYAALEKLITNPSQLLLMHENMLALSKPDAAFNLAQQLLELADKN